MGLTLKCTKTGSGCDLSYNGFCRFREKVAYLVNDGFGAHYAKLSLLAREFAFGSDSDRCKQAYDEFDRETDELVEKLKISRHIVHFLFQADTDGKLSVKVCKRVYAVIKDHDDDVVYGYKKREPCTTFGDLKALFKECCETRSSLIWH